MKSNLHIPQLNKVGRINDLLKISLSVKTKLSQEPFLFHHIVNNKFTKISLMLLWQKTLYLLGKKSMDNSVDPHINHWECYFVLRPPTELSGAIIPCTDWQYSLRISFPHFAFLQGSVQPDKTKTKTQIKNKLKKKNHKNS